MNQSTRSNSRRTLIILGVIVIVGVVAGIISAQFNSSKTPAYLSSYGGDFTLQSSQGPKSLADFKGKVVAIYFGYTSCPDACPLTLSLLTSAMNQLAADEQGKVQVLLITFDPERDTPAVLDAYVKQYHPNILGLTGTPQEISKVAGLYGALYERVEMPDSALMYAFDHSSVTAVIDVEGNIRSLVRHQDSIEDIVAKLREAMQG